MPSERVRRQLDRLLDEAEKAMASGEWEVVRLRAEAVLRLDSLDEDAQAYLDAATRGDPAPGSEPRAPAAAATPSAALPASFASGRYEVLKFLGEGGRKRVYLAHDTRLDREVALAVIKTEGLDVAGLARVRNEAQSMARLGDHPNIVTVFDVGDDPSTSSGQAPSTGPGQAPSTGSGQVGQPYIVSQHMAGGSVEDLIAKAEDHKLPLDQTLTIAEQVCQALGFAHQKGVVHRDLKPGNVWLTAGGIAKLGDFGLAVALDRSRVTMAGTMLGTVAYMPPEQALGGESTPKADLYSLGCMLYEMVTGRPPFLGEDPTAVISQHINTPPVAPSWLTDRCPPDLEEVILHLLAKSPDTRPESAAEVRVALAKVDPAQKSASHSDSSENPLDRLARGVFVGRHNELEKLRKAFDEAFAGHGSLVMLVGEPGIGKTRTAQELETYARMRGATVLWGRTHESSGAPAYWPWYQVGNAYAAANDVAAVIAPQLPPGAGAELSRIFTWLRQQPNFVEPEPITDPESAQFRLFEAYAAFIRAMAGQTPLLIALDDLHWADKPTLLLLQYVARELSRLRVMIVGNFRDTDITRQSALSESLAVLNRDPGFERIVLRGLSRDEVAAYIRATANVEPKREVVDKIFEETEGNAFFLAEVVNLMAQEGTLTRESVSDIRIPDGVREALGRRLNRLSDDANALLQVAAIIGREFSYDMLTLLDDPSTGSGRTEDQLLRLIDEALDARVIEETHGAGRYRFTHAQMQETLLAELSTTRRVRLHGQVGEALEKRWGQSVAEERSPRLAQHFLESSTLTPRHAEKAALYSALAGRQAMGQAAYADAVRHFQAALSAREGQEIDDEMAELIFDFGKACDATFATREAWRAFRQAFAHHAATGNVARAVDVAEYAGSRPAYVAPTMTAMIERALALVEEGSEECGRLNSVLGYCVGMLGDDERAQQAFSRARDAAARLSLPRRELENLSREMGVDTFHWRLQTSIEKAERVVDLAKALSDPVSEYQGHFYAFVKYTTGDLEGAGAHADAARAAADRTRVPGHLVTATFAQAMVAWQRGDWDRARSVLAEGLQIDHRDSRLLVTMALVEMAVGDSRAAEEYFQRLVEVMKATPPAPSLPYAYVAYYLGAATYLAGRAPEPELLDLAARTVLSSPFPPTPFIATIVHQALALDAYRRDDREEARDLLALIESFRGVINGFLAVDHLRGLLFVTLERLDEAVEAIESALALLSAGYKPSCAWAAYDCARIRLQRGATGDRERARVLIDEALGIAQELGMKPTVERVLRLKLETQGISSGDVRTSIDAVTESVQAEKPDLPAAAVAPDGTVTILFTDIEAHTELVERLGDQAWMTLLQRHNALIREQIRAHNGFEVKTIGDGFMVAFQSARRGLECAIGMQRAVQTLTPWPPLPVAGEGEPESGLPSPLVGEVEPALPSPLVGEGPGVRVRIGLHAGEAIKDMDDFYGKNVILASRIGGIATGGQILVSALLKELTESSGSFRFDEGREIALKGLTAKQRVYEVAWQ